MSLLPLWRGFGHFISKILKGLGSVARCPLLPTALEASLRFPRYLTPPLLNPSPSLKDQLMFDMYLAQIGGSLLLPYLGKPLLTWSVGFARWVVGITVGFSWGYEVGLFRHKGFQVFPYTPTGKGPIP